jgi:predicted MPP superfamily phosphohydrolase
LAIIGHIGIWCVAFNRTHATALPRKTRKLAEKLVIVMVLLPIISAVWTIVQTGDLSFWGNQLYATSVLLFGYGLGCLAISPYFIVNWLYRRCLVQPNPFVVSQGRELVNVTQELNRPLTEGTFAKLLGMIPFNQATQLAIEKLELQFPELPKSLKGLKVAQLSDFHFTGQIQVEYFQEIVGRVNEFEPDLVLITGDLIDEHHCLDWIEPVFGNLNSKHGVFYVFGNHDLRIKDEGAYRDRLKKAGLICLGGVWETVEMNGATIGLAGNELPWYSGAEALPSDPPKPVDFKILLSHSPDQMNWAKPFGFNWMLAGHTHGGQIQLPLIGPIVAPSNYGVKYASGAFVIGSMFMYVSRGISGDEAVRINCPPEVGFFVLNDTN